MDNETFLPATAVNSPIQTGGASQLANEDRALNYLEEQAELEQVARFEGPHLRLCLRPMAEASDQ